MIRDVSRIKWCESITLSKTNLSESSILIYLFFFSIFLCSFLLLMISIAFIIMAIWIIRFFFVYAKINVCSCVRRNMKRNEIVNIRIGMICVVVKRGKNEAYNCQRLCTWSEWTKNIWEQINDAKEVPLIKRRNLFRTGMNTNS